MNNRLLHATARGARIQILWDEWEDNRCVTVWDLQHGQYGYRIHPDDEHLAYGPVSTALREMAKTPSNTVHVVTGLPPHLGILVDHQIYEELTAPMASDELTRNLFMLILSECYADLGL